MNTDLILYLCGLGLLLIGFIFGRIERKDSYTKTYRYGFEIGKRVGERNASE